MSRITKRICSLNSWRWADATATFDYPDVGQGGMAAAEVHSATLVILSVAIAHVMATNGFTAHTTTTRLVALLVLSAALVLTYFPTRWFTEVAFWKALL